MHRDLSLGQRKIREEGATESGRDAVKRHAKICNPASPQ